MELSLSTGGELTQALALVLSEGTFTMSITHIMDLAVSAGEISFSLTPLGMAVVIGGFVFGYVALRTTIFQDFFNYICTIFNEFSLERFLERLNTITSGVAAVLPNVRAIAAEVNRIRPLIA